MNIILKKPNNEKDLKILNKCIINEKIANDKKDIEFLIEYIIKEEYVLTTQLKFWNEYKNNISKNMLYSIYNFKNFIEKKLKYIKIIKLKNKINEMEDDEKNREYLNELVECEIVNEDNLHKWIMSDTPRVKTLGFFFEP